MINFLVWDLILYSKFLTSIQDHILFCSSVPILSVPRTSILFALANDMYLFAVNVAGDQNLRLKLGLGMNI